MSAPAGLKAICTVRGCDSKMMAPWWAEQRNCWSCLARAVSPITSLTKSKDLYNISLEYCAVSTHHKHHKHRKLWPMCALFDFARPSFSLWREALSPCLLWHEHWLQMAAFEWCEKHFSIFHQRSRFSTLTLKWCLCLHLSFYWVSQISVECSGWGNFSLGCIQVESVQTGLNWAMPACNLSERHMLRGVFECSLNILGWNPMLQHVPCPSHLAS